MNSRFLRQVVFWTLGGFLLGVGASPGATLTLAPTTADPLLVYPPVFDKPLGQFYENAIELILGAKLAKQEGRTKLVKSNVHGIDEAIRHAEGLLAAGKLKQLSETEIEAIHGKIILLERLSQRFNSWGEPVGHDLRLRAEDYRVRLTALAEERVKDEVLLNKVKIRLRRVEENLSKVQNGMRQVTQLLDRKQPEQAQLLFWRLKEEIEPKTIWYGRKNVPNRPVALNSLDTYRNSCNTAAQAVWRAQAQKECDVALKSLDTDYGKMIQDADQASSGLSKGATAPLDGTPVSGPAAIEALGERWRRLDLAMLQARGWGWYNGRLGGDNKASLLIAQRSHSRNVAAALGRVIAADAARIKPEEAAELYEAYVKSLTPLVLLIADPSVLAPIDQSLGTLAARAPGLQAEVAAYLNATSEILRWRERIAAAVARSRMAQAPIIEQLAGSVALPEVENRGPLLKTSQSLLAARATHPVPVMMGRLVGLIGKPTTALNLVSLGPDKTLAMTGYQQPVRCYAKITPNAAKAAVTALAVDLLSTDTRPPLSLEARVALDGAKIGDLMAVGGPIVKLGLVSWGEHFAKLPASQRGPVRLGPIPTDAVSENELVVLVQLDATWMAGRYYFVDVPATEER